MVRLTRREPKPLRQVQCGISAAAEHSDRTRQDKTQNAQNVFMTKIKRGTKLRVERGRDSIKAVRDDVRR